MRREYNMLFTNPPNVPHQSIIPQCCLEMLTVVVTMCGIVFIISVS